jgi:hypothetical protein
MTRIWKVSSARAIFITAVVLLLAFVNKTTPPEAIIVTPNVPLQTLIDTNLTTPPDMEHSPVLEQLAPPLFEQHIFYPNHHVPGQMDTIRVLHYDGLVLTIYEVSHSNKAFIIYLKVTLPYYQTAEGLQVGDTRAEVEAILGAPDTSKNYSSSYDLSDAGGKLLVTYRDNRVSGLEWQFYWD